MPLGSGSTDPLILLASSRMDAMLEALAENYEIIVLLTPAMNRRAEARLLAGNADLAVLLSRGDGTDAVTSRSRDALVAAGKAEVVVMSAEAGRAADKLGEAA